MVASGEGFDSGWRRAAVGFGAEVQGLDDEATAEAIEAHGRAALERDGEGGEGVERAGGGHPASLRFYLRAIPDLPDRPVPLDAAIDVALRGLVHQGLSPVAARARLVAAHPGLARAVEEAAVLAEALVATSDLRRRIAGSARPLPCEFGPSAGAEKCRFQLVELLGSGSGGRVYRAVDRFLSDAGFSALVAVKVFDAVDATGWLRERFVEEASKARRVQHPNVVRVLDREVSAEGEDFIVYEFVEGGTLGEWREEGGARATESLVRVAAGVVRGVQAAHSAGVVHCDLKPANILMGVDGQPRVSDFGVAVRREAWAESADAATTDRPVGNLAFISPEQYRMEPGALSPVSDVYALGGILFWLLTGRLPNGETLSEIERRHADGDAQPPALDARTDRDLAAVCARAMAARPEHRYQSAGQLADDLDRWLAREPIRWTRPSFARVARLWSRRRPGLAAALAALAVVGAASVAVIQDLHASGLIARAVAAAAGERLRIREEERRDALGQAYEVIGPLVSARARHRPWEVLALTPYLDWVLGTSVLGDPGAGKPVWADRISLVRGMLDSARARRGGGGGDTGFEALSLEMTLGFWLLVERRPAEALPVIERNRAGWRAVVPGESDVHEWAGLLEGVARVQMAEAPRAGAEMAALRARAARVADGPTGTALRKLVARTLAERRGVVGGGRGGGTGG